MRPRLCYATTFLSSCLLLFVPPVPAQMNNDPFASMGSTLSGTKSYQTQGAVLILTGFNEKHALLDRQSVVKLENKATHSTMWQTTADKSEAYFVDLLAGQYDLEISAMGYLPAHKL